MYSKRDQLVGSVLFLVEEDMKTLQKTATDLMAEADQLYED